jgi:dTDP-glucose pyrophosphorylase
VGRMKKIRIGVIPAAGRGERMGYLSRILPKCLLPLYDKPIIDYIIQNMKNIGIEQIYIPVFYQKEKIIEYLSTTVEDDVNLEFIKLDQLPKGIALTIASAKRFINEPFMVILGDDCTITHSLQNIVDAFFRTNAIAVEGVVRERSKNVLKSTCCLKLDKNKKILDIMEKPKSPISNIRGTGVYVFSPEIFKFIEMTPLSPPRSEVEITNTIKLVAQKGKAYAEFINGVNININTPEDLLKAWIVVRKFRDKYKL